MRKKTFKILLLPGDGIGPEIMREVRKLLDVLSKRHRLLIDEGQIGGASLDTAGVPITEDLICRARACDAVLLGAVGGPRWDNLPAELRPEQGLLKLRKALAGYANLRPVKVFPGLMMTSTLRPEIIEGVDFVVVRELTGGIYFGRPRGIRETARGRKGYNTEVYHRHEIERIARFAFALARQRRRKVTSVDKANILESSMLWRQTVEEVHRDFTDVILNHLYVDNCAMQMIRNPKQFDVLLTNNMFGDILSDEAAMVCGSIGMLSSACLGGHTDLYEPIHGSAPDIAGQGKANPCAAILSLGLMLRYTIHDERAASAVEQAVDNVLCRQGRTSDISAPALPVFGTSEMGDRVRNEFQALIKVA